MNWRDFWYGAIFGAVAIVVLVSLIRDVAQKVDEHIKDIQARLQVLEKWKSEADHQVLMGTLKRIGTDVLAQMRPEEIEQLVERRQTELKKA